MVSAEPKYSIDLQWLEKAGLSFSAMAFSRFCPRSQEELKTLPLHSLPPSQLLETLKQCCSTQENFITAAQPLMESLFRLLLAHGNQPMNLEEIGQELGKRRGMRPSSPQWLRRLLEADTFYGLHQAPTDEPG